MTYLPDHLCSTLLETNYNLRITFKIDFELICWQLAPQRPVLLWEHLCFHTSSWNLPLLLTSAFKHFRYIQALANIPLLQTQVAAGWYQPGHLNGHPTVSTAGMTLLPDSFLKGKTISIGAQPWTLFLRLPLVVAFTQITHWREKRFSFYDNSDHEQHGWFFSPI